MNLLTLVGNLTKDPELRYIQSGAAVANFTVAHTPRTYNKTTNEWVDGETLFMRCTLWRDAAENVANTLTRGDRVIVTGKLKQRSYEKDGDKRTTVELEVEEVGASLRYATAELTKVGRNGAPTKPAAKDNTAPWPAADDIADAPF